MSHPGQRIRGPFDLRSILEASAFAPALSPFEMSRIEHDMVERKAAGGANVVSKGAPVEHWIVVVDGMVKVESSAHDGRRTTLIGVTRGGWFGEGSVLKGGRWPFDAVASTPTTVGLMPRSTFEWLLSSSVAFNRFLLEQINARLAQFVGRCEHSRFCDSGQHVAHCLAELFDSRLYPLPEPELRLSQQDVADLAGISRPTANRALRRLESQGVLSIRYGAITVRNPEALRQLGSLR